MKRQIREEYERKMQALETVWEMAKPATTRHESQPTATSVEAVSSAEEENYIPLRTDQTDAVGTNAERELSRGELTQAVVSVIPEMTDTFTARQVKQRIERRFPNLGEIREASLSSALKRLAETSPHFRMGLVGSGRRPTQYHKAQMKNAS